jgi:hypothetical protein
MFGMPLWKRENLFYFNLLKKYEMSVPLDYERDRKATRKKN